MKKFLAVAICLLLAVCVSGNAFASPFATSDVISHLTSMAIVGADSFYFDGGHILYKKVIQVETIPGQDPKVTLLSHDYGEPKREIILTDGIEMIKTGQKIPVSIKKEKKIASLWPLARKDALWAEEFYSRNKDKFDEIIHYLLVKTGWGIWAIIFLGFIALPVFGMFKIAFLNFKEYGAGKGYFIFLAAVAASWLICPRIINSAGDAGLLLIILLGLITAIFIQIQTLLQSESFIGFACVFYILVLTGIGSSSFIEAARGQFIAFFIFLYLFSFVFVRLWHSYISKWIQKAKTKRKSTCRGPNISPA